MHTLGNPHSFPRFSRSLKTSPKNDFFTIEILHIANKINQLSLETNVKLFSISKIKNKKTINCAGKYY